MTDPSQPVIEWAPFRLAPGVAEAALIEASDRMQRDFLEAQDGFLRRELVEAPDGFADLVLWRSRAAAEAAMAAVEASPTCRAYFALMGAGGVDPGDGVLHCRVLRRYAAAG